MTAADFAELATWRYEPPYDFYDGDQEEPLNPERYFAARDDGGEMIGFYYYEPVGDDARLRPRPSARPHGARARPRLLPQRSRVRTRALPPER